jgi:SAM-dependent methyltransferase
VGRCLVCGGARADVVLTQSATTVLQCADCGLVFVDPLPGERELRSLYLDYDVGEDDPGFADALTWARTSRAPVFREILDAVVARGARGRLLDVGCSFGILLSMAKDRGFEPCGVDLSLNAVRYARDRAGLPVHHGTLFDARFPDAAFDVVTMVSVFEHVPNPRETLAEIFRVLRPRGILVVQVPNANFNLLRGRIHRSWFYIGTHLTNFPPGTLSLTLERAGFSCARLWCGKGDRPKGWPFRLAKSTVVTAARIVSGVCRCHWGPSLLALAVKA